MEIICWLTLQHTDRTLPILRAHNKHCQDETVSAKRPTLKTSMCTISPLIPSFVQTLIFWTDASVHHIFHHFIGLDITVLLMLNDECCFNRMKRGELFDYLTDKVTLSEKETRSAPIVDSPIIVFKQTNPMLKRRLYNQML